MILGGEPLRSYITTTMTGFTKRKISGLTGVELQLALQQLRKIRSSIVVEEVQESDPGAPEDTFADELESMMATLEARQNDPSVRLH